MGFTQKDSKRWVGSDGTEVVFGAFSQAKVVSPTGDRTFMDHGLARKMVGALVAVESVLCAQTQQNGELCGRARPCRYHG